MSNYLQMSERRRMAIWMNGGFKAILDTLPTTEDRLKAIEEMQELERLKIMLQFMINMNFTHKVFKKALADNNPVEFGKHLKYYLPQSLHRIAFKQFRARVENRQLSDFTWREAAYQYYLYEKRNKSEIKDAQ
jgi:hypothetical protein